MIHHFILVNVSLLYILITSDQFVNIVYMSLLYLIYLIGLSEINEAKRKKIWNVMISFTTMSIDSHCASDCHYNEYKCLLISPLINQLMS